MESDMFFIILAFVTGFILAYYMIPYLKAGLRRKGYVARDMYKPGKDEIPTQGGILILMIVIFIVSSYNLAISLILGLARNLPNLGNDLFLTDINVTPLARDINEQIAFVIILFSLFGVLDDYLEIPYSIKTVLPIVFTFPIMFVVATTGTYFFINSTPDRSFIVVLPETEIGGHYYGAQLKYIWLLRYIVAPIYVIVVAQLVNSLSGFNGQASGCSFIILMTLILKSLVWLRSTNDIVVGGALAGTLLAFWYFNRYPAQIFEGNIGSMLIGAGIGCIIVIKGFIISGMILFIPHAVNFISGFYWSEVLAKKFPHDVRYAYSKFGRVDENGGIVPPGHYTIKWWPAFYSSRPVDEWTSTKWVYLFVVICCTVSFFVPY